MEGKDLMNMSPVEQVTAYADLVRKVIPSVPDEVLEKLTVPQLQRIHRVHPRHGKYHGEGQKYG